MVDRNSQDVQINAGQAVGQQQAASGYVGVDANAFAESKTYAAPPEVSNAGDRLLSRIVGVGDQLAGQAVKVGLEEAYLSGVAKAGTIKNEDELEGNFMTKQWATAGYRDTMGRIAAADNEAQIAQDMHKMREKSPEEFASYLAEKRKSLIGSWEGMSLATRQTMFAQQMLQERAQIQKHGSEHYKFVVDTEQKSIKTGLETSFATLNASKTDAAAYSTATDATFGALYSSVITNPKLPEELRGKLLAQAATHALETDNQALFDKIHNTQVTHTDGHVGPMSNALSWEDDTALSKANVASRKRTEAFRAADFMDRTAKYEADWSNPNTELMPLEAVRSHLAEGVQRGLVSADQYQSIMHNYYSASAKKVVQSDLAHAYVAGDQSKYVQLGKTQQEGLDAFVQVMGRKMTLPQIVDNLFSIGASTGQSSAYKKVGELMAPAFAQIGNNDKIDPANAASIAQTLKRLDVAEGAGQDGAFHQFLSALDPEVQAKVTYMRANLRKGNEPTTAIAAATAQVLEDQKLTPALRAELAGANAKEIIKEVNDITPRGIFSTGMLYVKSFVSPTAQGRQNAASTLATTARQGWFENDSRVNEVMAGTRLAVSEKMQEISTTNPHMAIADVKSMALSDVSSRAVGTDWGPLIVPKGFTPQQYFKVGADVGTERIGEALKEYVKPTGKDNRMAFSVGVHGELMMQELTKEGRQASPARTLDPAQVAPMVEAQRQRQVEAFKLDHGPGVTKTVGSASVNYNGDNTVNADNTWMRRVRDDLVGHEGVRDTVYKDSQGNDTIGVGILLRKAGSNANVSGIKPDINGKITPQQITDSFLRASDRAAGAASRVMLDTGVRSEPAFKLYTNLAYQSGAGFASLPAYKPMLAAVVAKDAPAAEAALKATPAYKMSAPDRQKYYLTQLQAAMKG